MRLQPYSLLENYNFIIFYARECFIFLIIFRYNESYLISSFSFFAHPVVHNAFKEILKEKKSFQWKSLRFYGVFERKKKKLRINVFFSGPVKKE
jgi:hypothetical protein